MKTGVTESTKQNIQLGAGVLCTTYTNKTISGIIGATRGGGSFVATPTLRQIEADGLPQYTKGFEIIDDWSVDLNTTLIEFSETTLKKALPSASASTSGKVTTITCGHDIADTEYADIYWVGDTADGNNIVIKLKNALNIGGLNFTITNKGEGTFAVALKGHYDLTKLDEAPFEIILDKSDNA